LSDEPVAQQFAEQAFQQWALVPTASLEPGSYKLLAEAVRPEFGGGSSVGPYAINSDGESFKNPIRSMAFTAVHTVAAGSVIDVGTLTVK
jgi:hypothetical protein